MRQRLLWSIVFLFSASAGCNAILGNKLYELSDGGEVMSSPDDATIEASTPLDEAGRPDAAADDSTVGVPPEAGGGDGGCNSLTDIQTCGSCATDCTKFPNVSTTGLGCTGGRCSYACEPGYADCADSGTGCTTALSSASSCGGCGVTCMGATPVCAPSDAGVYACANGCSAGETDCSSTCTNKQTDKANCGSCGHACTGGETCQAGVCSCPSGQTLCAGTCVNVSGTDLNNCGSCGASCAMLPHVATTGLACTAGKCSYGCAAGYADCGNTGTGCGTTLGTATNCSGCGAGCSGGTPVCSPSGSTYACTNGCTTGQTNCNGKCTIPATDPNNCGTCGTVCTGGQHCAGGCQCNAGDTFCNNTACVNTSTDANNCGGCTKACSANMVCVGGACQCPSGETGTACTCGNGVLNSGEQCDPKALSESTWICSPTCTSRTVYTAGCTSTTGACDSNSTCQLNFCAPNYPYPNEPSGCPSLAGGYTQGLFYGQAWCVISCPTPGPASALSCPPQFTTCMANPFADAGGPEAANFCVP